MVNKAKVGYAGLTLAEGRNWLLQAGDILFSHINSAELVGKCAIYRGVPSELVHGMNLLCLRPDPSRIDFNYAPWLIRSSGFRSRLSNFVNKAVNQASISIGNLRTIAVDVPSVQEQRRIAAMLDQAEALRAKRRQALAKLETFPQSLFLEMFGDPLSNPKSWTVLPFGRCAENQDGRRRPVKASDRAERKGSFPYYGASGIIDMVDGYLFEGERLLIGEDGANLLARSTPIAFMAKGRYWVNNHAHVVGFNGVARLDYLEVFFSLIDLDEYITGSAQPKLNQEQLNKIPITIPPMDKQEAFGERLASWQGWRQHQVDSLQAMSKMSNALQQRAFRGEL
ncbi:MAG: restriction endonuclease subunit S [Janthinobacterium lividum]